MTYRSDPPTVGGVEALGLIGIQLMDTASQCLNGFLMGNPAETISSRAFRSDLDSVWHLVRRVLDVTLSPINRDWCCNSYNRCLERSKRLLRDQ